MFDSNLLLFSSHLKGLASYFPILKMVPYGGYRTSMRVMRDLEQRIQGNVVAEHVRNFDPENVKDDLIDLYLNEMHKAQLNDKDTTFSRYQLIRLCSDLLVAGTDTTGGREFL